jgi:hypothetical protein
MDNKTINYFLFLKKKYECILMNLLEIHTLYNEILETSSISSDIIENEIINKNENESKIKYIRKMINYLNDKISITCDHNYEDDLIDIDLDRSKKITYCTICEQPKYYMQYF